MEVTWFLEFDTPALAAWNMFCLGITVLALVMFVRRLVRREGLRWRDLCFLPNLVVNGAAVPVFIVVWLVAEWVSTDEAQAPIVDGEPWVPDSQA